MFICFCDVDFSRLCIVILGFTELSPEFLTNEITFPLSNSKIAMELKKMLLRFVFLCETNYHKEIKLLHNYR